VRSGIPRSGPCDQDQTREIRPGGGVNGCGRRPTLTRRGMEGGGGAPPAAGGAAPSRGGEVTGVGAGACYSGFGVAEVGQRGGRRLGELDGGAVATSLRSERGKWRRKSSGRVGGTPVRDSDRGERA
jgi:hypothetical protein